MRVTPDAYGEVAYSADRLIVNLQRVVIDPAVGQVTTTCTAEDGFAQIRREACILDVDILANRIVAAHQGLNQKGGQLAIR